MWFNSLQFGIFFLIIFVIYWMLNKKDLRWQNCLLMVASYFFYACWNWHFLFLLFLSTLIGYVSGFNGGKRKSPLWFVCAVVLQLGILAAFKYYNFFVDALVPNTTWTLKVILPVGISFYTFHGLSYMIDVYKGKIGTEKSFVNYALFVSFFPLLVAGPIERATHLLPQIKQKRTFEYSSAVDGLRQIVWGLFKKIVIADQCADYVNQIFNNSGTCSSSTLTFGAILFAVQIYGDFSGYSDIAIGTARLLGFDLLRNFAFPFFSRDIAEFWRRWHISLSSWFRDYLYIPLGGSRGSTSLRIRNIVIIFLVCGLWHGANWTFLVWGALNALFMIPAIVCKTNRKHLDIVAKGKLFPTLSELLSIILTFGLTTFAFIFFRAQSLTTALVYIENIFSLNVSLALVFPPKALFVFLPLFVVLEWLGREQQHALANFGLSVPSWVRLSFYFVLVLCILYFSGTKQQFIYFQF